MSKSINYNSISETAISLLSSFNIAYYTASDIRKAHKEAVENAEKALQEKLNERQVLIDNGMSVNDAIAKISTLEEGRALERAKVEQTDAHKKINKLYADGRSLVTKEVYESYLKYTNTNNIENFKNDVVTFLATLGINAKTEWAVSAKFADTMVTRVSGIVKATGQSKKDKNYIKSKTFNTFRDIFVLSFLQTVVKEKHVLDMNDDFTLSRHDFSNDNQNDQNNQNKDSDKNVA